MHLPNHYLSSLLQKKRRSLAIKSDTNQCITLSKAAADTLENLYICHKKCFVSLYMAFGKCIIYVAKKSAIFASKLFTMPNLFGLQGWLQHRKFVPVKTFEYHFTAEWTVPNPRHMIVISSRIGKCL